jgi:uncharacterized protein DUF2442
MTASPTRFAAPLALEVAAPDGMLAVGLSDGRTVSVPLARYPRLLHANRAEQENWRLIGQGESIRWPDIDEDISTASLTGGAFRARVRRRCSVGWRGAGT